MAKAIQKGRSIILFITNSVMPDLDPASPAVAKDGRSRIPRSYAVGGVRDDALFGLLLT